MLRTRIAVAVPIAGVAVTHGLPTTPDDYYFAALDSAAATQVWFSSTPAGTQFVNLTGAATGTIHLFAAVSHSIIA